MKLTVHYWRTGCPKKNGTYLVLWDDHYCDVADFDDGDWINSSGTVSKPLYWTELPK